MRVKFITLISAALCAVAVFQPTAKANGLLIEENDTAVLTTSQPNVAGHSLSAQESQAVDSTTLDNAGFSPKIHNLEAFAVDELSSINVEVSDLEKEGFDTVNAEAIDLEAMDLEATPCTLDTCIIIIASESDVTAQATPSAEQILQIQQELRNLSMPGAENRRRRRVYPGITISNPTGYGADRGQVFAGFGYQSRSRLSSKRAGTAFGGGNSDGTAGFGFGVGDARESVGLQVSYIAASFGGSRPLLSGGLNAKVHKRFGNNLSVAVGGEGIINFGRLAKDDDGIEFNDFENTYYSAMTYTVNLREDFNQPFSRLMITGGAGTGRFRPVDDFAQGNFAIGVFGSAALQVMPWATVITEWTGQDLTAGMSIAPFPNIPLVLTPAFRDLAGESDGDPRFVVGVGVSLSDLFSR